MEKMRGDGMKKVEFWLPCIEVQVKVKVIVWHRHLPSKVPRQRYEQEYLPKLPKVGTNSS